MTNLQIIYFHFSVHMTLLAFESVLSLEFSQCMPSLVYIPCEALTSDQPYINGISSAHIPSTFDKNNYLSVKIFRCFVSACLALSRKHVSRCSSDIFLYIKIHVLMFLEYYSNI